MLKTILIIIACAVSFVVLFVCLSLIIKSDTKSVSEDIKCESKINYLEYDNDEYDYGHNVNIRQASENE